MIIPRLHDRLLLAGTIAAAVGTVLARNGDGMWGAAGVVLLAAGAAAIIFGLGLKIRKEK